MNMSEVFSSQYQHPTIPAHFHFTSPPPNINSPMSDKVATPKPRPNAKVASSNANADYLDGKPLIEFSSGGEEMEGEVKKDGNETRNGAQQSNGRNTNRRLLKPTTPYDDSSDRKSVV